MKGIRKYIVICTILAVILIAASAQASSLEKSVPQKLKKQTQGLMPAFDINVPQYMTPNIHIGQAGDNYVIARNRQTGEIKRFYGMYYYYGWDDDWEIIYRGKDIIPPVPGIDWKPLLRK